MGTPGAQNRTLKAGEEGLKRQILACNVKWSCRTVHRRDVNISTGCSFGEVANINASPRDQCAGSGSCNESAPMLVLRYVCPDIAARTISIESLTFGRSFSSRTPRPLRLQGFGQCVNQYLAFWRRIGVVLRHFWFVSPMCGVTPS